MKIKITTYMCNIAIYITGGTARFIYSFSRYFLSSCKGIIKIIYKYIYNIKITDFFNTWHYSKTRDISVNKMNHSSVRSYTIVWGDNNKEKKISPTVSDAKKKMYQDKGKEKGSSL